MKAADKTLKDHEALEYSLMAKNMEINNKGFSSFQIVYGSNPKVPGITYGTPPSLSNEYKSVDIKKNFERLNSSENLATSKVVQTSLQKGIFPIFLVNLERLEISLPYITTYFFKSKD